MTEARFAKALGPWMLLILLAFLPLRGADRPTVGLIPNPGVEIPADIRCLNERGEEFPLHALLDRPAILSLVYYRCEHVCPQVLVGLGRLVSALDLQPAKDYRLITLSFDADDTPAAAAAAHKNYSAPLGPALPDGAWTFATASEDNISKLTKTLGFRFEKHGHGFIHPAILVVLMPGGRVSRYVDVSKYNYGVAYPVNFPPVEMKQALLEAGRGRVSPAAPASLLFCFPSEPPGQARFFRLTAIMGWITLVLLVCLFVFLSVARKRAKED